MNKQNSSQISYADKDVFVGLDVHKKTYAVVARVEERSRSDGRRLPPHQSWSSSC